LIRELGRKRQKERPETGFIDQYTSMAGNPDQGGYIKKRSRAAYEMHLIRSRTNYAEQGGKRERKGYVGLDARTKPKV